MEYYTKPKYELKYYKEGGHYCEPKEAVPHRVGAPAITVCWEDKEGKLWVANGEYLAQVNYCPFTGKKAEKQIE